MRMILCLLLPFLLTLAGGCGVRDEASTPAAQSAAPESSAPEARSAIEPEPPVSAAPETSATASPEAPAELSEAASTPAEPPVAILKMTVPEGYTLARIAMQLEEMGVCTVEDFIEATQGSDFSGFPLFAAQLPDERRCFRMEGYLFPDTYEIYSDDPPEEIIRRMLSHTEQKLGASIRDKIAASGYTVDEILTLASIIEKEAFGHAQMPMISSVLHNRLQAGMQLQCDVTIAYVEGAIKPFITGDINRYNEHYNTYKCEALPAGAICNPGLDAINAALAPARSDYLFFVTDGDKNYYYAETWEEHLVNVREAGIGSASAE